MKESFGKKKKIITKGTEKTCDLYVVSTSSGRNALWEVVCYFVLYNIAIKG